MKKFLIIKIVIAVAVGLFVGKLVTPLLGLTSTLASFAISTGITITLLMIMEGIINKMTSVRTETIPMGEIKNLYKVRKDEISKAAVVLADAFKDDPLWTSTIEKDVNKSHKYQMVAEMLLKYCHKYGVVYASSENSEGIMALTQDEKSYITMWRLIKSGAIVPFLRIGLKSLMTMSGTFTPIDEVRKKHMKHKSFIYLQIIGVSTEKQGNGHGGKLLRTLIDMSDEENIPIYLETETESNVSLYERFGFKTLEQMNLPVINQPMWAMIRDVKVDEQKGQIIS